MPTRLFWEPLPPSTARRPLRLTGERSFMIRTVLRSPQELRNIHLMSIDYAFRPRLRSRLTLGGFPFPRNPWAYGVRDSHPLYRYSSSDIHFLTLHEPFRARFNADRNALLPHLRVRGFGSTLIPNHSRRRTPRPVSYYALFKWWLLLSQHPGCLRNLTSFSTELSFRGLSWRSGLFPSRPRILAPIVCLP